VSEVISSKLVKARKDHFCGYCDARAIKAGDEYLREVLVGDGRVYTWVSCAACQAVFAQVWDWAGAPWDEGIGRDTYIEWARETVRCGDGWVGHAQAFLDRTSRRG